MEVIFMLLSAGIAFAVLYILWDWYILNNMPPENSFAGLFYEK